jgi:hypothetical protein
MKKPRKQKVPEPKQLVALLDAATKDWVVEVAPGRYRVFTTKEEAESYCVTESRPRAKKTGYHQELPQSSVWTGAPWDHTFKHIH